MKQALGCMVTPALMVAVLLFMALTGSPHDRRVDAAEREGILLVGNGSEPASLDPHLAAGTVEHKILSALLEGLVTDHPDDETRAAPGVAESWESGDGERVWTFRLREDARWSDGTPVVAEDFVYAYQRLLSPELLADYASMLFVLKNGREFHLKKLKDFSQVGVKALDERTLELTLVGPTPHFLGMLKHFAWYPVQPKLIERAGGMLDRESDWTAVESYVGNGPFVLKRRALQEVIEVERNPYYWDAEHVRLQGIHFFPIDNAASEERAFLNGQLHYGYSLPLTSIPMYRAKGDAAFHSDAYFSVYFYRLNVKRPPLDDVRVRQALSLSIDRELITSHVLRGGQLPARGIVPELGNYRSPGRLGRDLEAARGLLAAAGFPGGKGMRSLEILINTSESHRTLAEALQEMWRRDLGVNVSIRSMDWNVYQDKQREGDFDISRAGWTGDYLDPMTFLDMWESDSGNNQTGWRSAKFDGLMAKARGTADAALRLAVLAEAEGLFLEELPALPIYVYTRQYLLDPRVGPWPPRLLDNRAWKYVGFQKSGSETVSQEP